MAIRLLASRETGASPANLIKEELGLGKAVFELYREHGRFYKEHRLNKCIAEIIRTCNTILGCGGNFKNGCLYREAGLAEVWTKSAQEEVACDHAIPAIELVRLHREDGVPLETLIFSPAARISKASNRRLTELGLAKKGGQSELPFERYRQADIKLVTHQNDMVDAGKWSSTDHWDLIQRTPELCELLTELKIVTRPQ